jgi:hypothetical protein
MEANKKESEVSGEPQSMHTNENVKQHKQHVQRRRGLTLKSQIHMTMSLMRRHSPSNLHVFLSQNIRSVS